MMKSDTIYRMCTGDAFLHERARILYLERGQLLGAQQEGRVLSDEWLTTGSLALGSGWFGARKSCFRPRKRVVWRTRGETLRSTWWHVTYRALTVDNTQWNCRV